MLTYHCIAQSCSFRLFITGCPGSFRHPGMYL
jgi:hypothetical protein